MMPTPLLVWMFSLLICSSLCLFITSVFQAMVSFSMLTFQDAPNTSAHTLHLLIH